MSVVRRSPLKKGVYCRVASYEERRPLKEGVFGREVSVVGRERLQRVVAVERCPL